MKYRNLDGIAFTKYINICRELKVGKHIFTFQVVEFRNNPKFNFYTEWFADEHKVVIISGTLFKVTFNLEIQ